MISIGTDCSGIEAPIEALKQLGIPFQHKWSCEIDKFAKMSIMANCPPEVMYTDITKRDHSQLPDVDMYVCGFPCQSFSTMGRMKGTQDPRGNIMLHCIEVIEKKLPNVFILENVKNFMYIEKGAPYRYLTDTLEGIEDETGEAVYSVYADVYNTKDYGVPQHRERVYIIGIRRDIEIRPYSKPSKLPMQPLDAFITDKTIQATYVPSKTLVKKIWNKGQDFLCPCDTYTKGMHNVCPTLTTNSHTMYHSTYNRFLNNQECLRLQGFSDAFVQVVSNRQMFKQIGNSMSVNVLKEIVNMIFQQTLLGHILDL